MKEYVAETGGRYTYTDDLLNLQELALSFTSIFDGCSNFIISGCEISGADITPGYVWINGKIRKFNGFLNATFPFYIYESNSIETTTYANESSKRGRICFQCSGGTVVPDIADPITGNVPAFIEMKADYSPRFIDKFFGKYAVLLESPFSKQTIKKELVLAGKLTGEKDIESKTSVAISNPANGFTLKNIVKTNGSGSVGVYQNGLLVNELVIETDGSFRFIKGGKVIAEVTENGMSFVQSATNTSQTGSIYQFGTHIVNNQDNSDSGSIDINFTGFNNGTTKFRNFNVYGGKSEIKPLFQVCGAENAVKINARLEAYCSKEGVLIINPLYDKENPLYNSPVKWLDRNRVTASEIGHLSENNSDFVIKNNLGNISLNPFNGHVDIKGDLKINGTSVANIYVSLVQFNKEIVLKVDKIAGKQLSAEDFTTAYRKKLDGINKGTLSTNIDGYAVVSEVNQQLVKKLDIAKNLSDIANKETARNNIEAEKRGTGELKLTKTSNLSDLSNVATARINLSVYSKVEITSLLANKLDKSDRYNGVVFTTALYNKLNAIATGAFYNVENGVTTYQAEGYVKTSAVVKELAKKANWLLSGYTASEKTSIASNLSIYSKTQSDARYGRIASYWSDYIAGLTSAGYSTDQAKEYLRNKIDSAGKSDLNNYLSKNGNLSDLVLANDTAKRNACQKLGAAFASDYQPKLTDTGWLQVSNYGSGTNTSRLFIRQFGAVVYIQGIINTRSREGSNQGGVIGYIPNAISTPRYGVRFFITHANESDKKNYGATFKIYGGAREIRIWESGFVLDTEICLSYMT